MDTYKTCTLKLNDLWCCVWPWLESAEVMVKKRYVKLIGKKYVQIYEVV